jgi:lysophospholipase L1-like esterase
MTKVLLVAGWALMLAATLFRPLPSASCPPAVKITLFGDSTMAGYDSRGLVQSTPAVVLQAEMDARFGRGSTVVESRAVGGTTAKQLVAGTDGLNEPWPRSVSAQVVVVNHGINDLTHDGDVTGYKAALRSIAQRTPATLIFETPNVVKEHDLRPYVQAMRDVAAEYSIQVADTFALSSTALLSDWAHPTDQGYAFLVRSSLAPAVAKTVARLRLTSCR